VAASAAPSRRGRRAPLRRAVALTLGSRFATRLMFAALLVFGTYNPTGTCYLTWLREGAADPVWKLVASGVLAVAYGVVVPLSLRALGAGGIALTTAAAASGLWVLVEAGLLDPAAPAFRTWMLLSLAAILLGTGLCWMIVAIALDGQVRLRDLTR
jgi:hypothetical protein